MDHPFFETTTITDYLTNKMPEPMKATFEIALKNDPNLAKEVELVRDMLQGIRLFEQKRLQNIIQQAHQQLDGEGFFEEAAMETETAPAVVPIFAHKRKFASNWLFAASFLLVLGVSAYFFMGKATTTEQLFTANFHPNTNILQEKIQTLSLIGFGTTDADQQKSLLVALQAYQNKKYDEAIALLQAHITAFPTHDADVKTYLALAFMETKQYEKAENTLKSSNNIDAKWYLSLCLMKNNKKPSAIALLKSIAKEKNIYQQQAEILLQQLEKN
jgi:tetratricopeptide (TPR) repeat protein